MPTPLRRGMRHARRGVSHAFVALVVLAALATAALSQFLPWVERNPDKVEAWLSQRAGQPVAFDAIQARWNRLGPLLELDGLRIGSGADAIPVGRAELLMAPYTGWMPGRSFTELRVRGLQLTMVRDAAGRWFVRGLPGQQQGGDPFDAVQALGEVQLIDARLTLDAPGLGLPATTIPKVNLRLQVNGDVVRAGMRAWRAPAHAPLQGSMRFERRTGDARAYAVADDIVAADWAPLLRLAGVQVLDARGEARVWATVRARRIVAVSADADITQLRMGGAPMAGVAQAPVAFDRVQGLAHWRVVDGGWRLDAPTLRVTRGERTQRMDGLMVAGGRRYGLLAEDVDAGPLLQVAGLSDRLLPGLRRWLMSARPEASLHDVRVAGAQGGAMRASGRIEGFGFSGVDGGPSLSGVSGTLLGDAGAVALQLDPASTLRFDWPRGFGVQHALQPTGTVAGWRDEAGWHVGSGGLRLANPRYAIDLRGGLLFEGDGSLPRIDAVANVADGVQVGVAKQFWPRNVMPRAAIDWLDAALVSGRIVQGRVLASGDLDEFPFRDHNGRFEARVLLRDATLKFQPDWPPLEHADAVAVFIGDGMTVDGSGSIAGIRVPRLHADIADFRRTELRIDAEGAGDAAQLLALLRQSPLRKGLEDTFAALSARGPAGVRVRLDLPLHAARVEPRIDGEVLLQGVHAEDARWKLAFDDLRGRASFDQYGFHGDDIAAQHERLPGRLSLRAGSGHVRDASHAFEADLAATMDAKALFAQAPQLRWLQPRVQGRSQWTIGVAVPRGATAAAPPSRLQLRSDLVGTRLDLPAPLAKPAAVALPTTVDVALPLGQGDIAVALGSRMALRARSRGQGTGVRIALGASQAGEPPASGLIATGRTPSLDAIDWVGLAMGGGGGNGPSLPLQQVDVTADRLMLLGGSFANTRVQVAPNGNALAAQLHGPAVEGGLSLPRDGRGAISGHLQRLHWRATTAGAGTNPNTSGNANAAQAIADVDPARIPPISLAVDDLRVGDAALGAAVLRTAPSGNGMRIEQLQLRAPRQQLDASGEWRGRGAQARTQLHAVLDSGDIGQFLARMGFAGQISRGKGKAVLDAGWTGGPGQFALARMEGRMALSVRDGQLVEVEPGAGRMLGLLSIAQLPRRLTLDFRDFFDKGFAFDEIEGNIAFGGGLARSDDLAIKGPAADIRIRGAANLRNQSYDQTIDVYPRTGNLLTVAGAIAGGPIGAAIGAAANAVLKKPLRQMGAKTYRVTGPWKDPKVEVAGRPASARP